MVQLYAYGYFLIQKIYFLNAAGIRILSLDPCHDEHIDSVHMVVMCDTAVSDVGSSTLRQIHYFLCRDKVMNLMKGCGKTR